MHANRTENELIFQETPGCLWFFGLLFAAVGGVFVFGAIGGFRNWDGTAFWQIALTLLIGSSGTAAGFWIIHNAPISKIVIDRVEDKIYLTRRRLFEKSETVYEFEEVERFRLIEDIDDEGSPIWYFGMDLIDGESIKITSLPFHSEEVQERQVFDANEFARKSMPIWETVLEIDERID